MGYLRRLVLVNSAGYPLADVRLDGHCDIAGGQGVGKTTLMNAILFPFVAEDRFIDIDRLEKQRFSLYYFPSEMNSFVIYEAVNNLDVPYCIFIHRSGQALYYHFISAPFDYDWIYDGDEQVRDWQDVRAKLNALGITYKTEDRRERFNNVFLGKGEHYHEQYSIVRSNKDRDAIRPLLSAIFRNQPFGQETLKNSLVAAVMSSNQLDDEGIDLASHRRNLDGFEERYSDIEKMTRKDKSGKTAVEPVAEALLDAVDRYYSNEQELRDIPGQLVFAYAAAKGRVSDLGEAISRNTAARDLAMREWEENKKDLQEKLNEAIGIRGGVNRELATIGEMESKYRERNVDVDLLVEWIQDRKSHQQELRSLEDRRAALTADARDISRNKEEALKENRMFHQNQELLEKGRHDRRNDALRAQADDIRRKTDAQRLAVEKEYRAVLGGDWRKSEMTLVDALADISGRLAAAETVGDIRDLIRQLQSRPDIESILSDVLKRRAGEAATAESLREKVAEARTIIVKELDRKAALEKEKEKKLAAVAAKEKEELGAVEKAVKEEEEKHNERLRAIIQEHQRRADEISDTYDTKIHGNDEAIRDALKELNELIQGEQEVLDAVDAFPSAAEDKARYFDRKPALVKEREELNLKINDLDAVKKKKEAQFAEEDGRLDSSIRQDGAEKAGLESEIRRADDFLENRSAVKAACEGAAPIRTERSLSDIIQFYSMLRTNRSDLMDRVCKNAQRLYEPGMLSRIDTFQLGIGLNDSLSSFEDFLGVAEKLRTRLENSEEGMGMDKFIRINSDIWLNEIRDIDTAMSPVENMLMQIGRLCKKATAFVKAHNATDCIDDFSMSIDENDTTDIVKLMRKISEFYKNNNTVLGADNIFAADDGTANREAVGHLRDFAVILNKDVDLKNISLSSMFNIRMDITEKGNAIKNLLSFNNPGSRGTAIVLKAMLNMTLLHIVLEKHQAPNTRLVCAIDEMNTIEARNLDALTDFASAAGLFIIGSGQHHTKSVLDYSYDVWDERGEDGTVHKFVSMDAVRSEDIPDDV